MSGSIPNIAMGFRPTPNVGTVYDPTVQIDAAQKALQLKTQQEQVDRQNALMGIFRDPKSLDGTGNPTPDALQKVMAVDPQAGISLRQNMMIGQERKLRTEALQSDLMSRKMEAIANASAPILEAYETDIKNGVPEEQAKRNAQASLVKSNEGLKTGGIFNEDDYKRFPTEFDPIQMRNVVAGTKQYQEWVKQNREDKKEAREETHQQAQDAAGLWKSGFGRDDKGEMVPGMYFTPKTGGEPVFHPGVVAAPAGGGSAAAARERDAETIGRLTLKAKTEPLTPDDEKQLALAKANQQARIDPTVDAADQKRKPEEITVDGKPQQGLWKDKKWFNLDGSPITGTVRMASSVRADRAQTDREKPTSVTVDGKAKDAIWKNGQWFEPDGTTPITGEVRLAAKPAAAGSLNAERASRFEEMKTAQQKAGTYTDDTAVHRALDHQMAEDKQTAISDDAALIAAQVSLKTGHPPAWMGRSQASLTKFLDAYAKEAKRQNLSADDIAANIAKFSGEMAEARTLGTSSARIDFAAKELDVALPTAMEASEKVWRPGFKKVAELQQAIKGQVSDPDLLEFAQFNQQVMSAYSAAMQRGGASTVHAMERAESLLSTATSQAGYMRQLDTLHKEVQTILYGTQAAKNHLRAEITGSPEITNPPTLSGVPRPPPKPTPEQLSGAPRITADAAGRKAYEALAPNTLFIAPDGTPHYTPTPAQAPAAPPAQPPASGAKPGSAATQTAPLPMPTKEADVVDGGIYQTAKGPARWDANKKQFFLVKGQ